MTISIQTPTARLGLVKNSPNLELLQPSLRKFTFSRHSRSTKTSIQTPPARRNEVKDGRNLPLLRPSARRLTFIRRRRSTRTHLGKPTARPSLVDDGQSPELVGQRSSAQSKSAFNENTYWNADSTVRQNVELGREVVKLSDRG